MLPSNKARHHPTPSHHVIGVLLFLIILSEKANAPTIREYPQKHLFSLIDLTDWQKQAELTQSDKLSPLLQSITRPILSITCIRSTFELMRREEIKTWLDQQIVKVKKLKEEKEEQNRQKKDKVSPPSPAVLIAAAGES
jgi:hypothetical protein